jgi:hypothetical protein
MGLPSLTVELGNAIKGSKRPYYPGSYRMAGETLEFLGENGGYGFMVFDVVHDMACGCGDYGDWTVLDILHFAALNQALYGMSRATNSLTSSVPAFIVVPANLLPGENKQN